ncbi:hypothetical protein CYMTET_33751, partial [Cymbomonas tetramitiformis]
MSKRNSCDIEEPLAKTRKKCLKRESFNMTGDRSVTGRPRLCRQDSWPQLEWKRATSTYCIMFTKWTRPTEDNWLWKGYVRANLRGAGWKDDDFDKPVVTVAAPWMSDIVCNMKFRELADACGASVGREGGKAFVHLPPVISDGIGAGVEANNWSLISRDIIADVIECMHKGYMADCIIGIGGCDKSVPGVLMPMARSNLIGVMMSGGSNVMVEYKGESMMSAGPVMALQKLQAGLWDIE